MRIPILDKDQIKKNRLVLEGIPPSHYVEKVRWCMDYVGVAYEEEQDIGVIGRFLVGRSVPVLKCPGKQIYVSNSSDILR